MTYFRATAIVVVIGAMLVLGMLVARGRQVTALSLPITPSPTAADRILVIAPHCDDETLGAGGLLSSAIHAGAAVKVVLITNGDGFHYGAERLFHEKRVAPLDYLRMGLDRQSETLSALSELGVPRSAVSFLGYPDGGTSAMWLSYWDRGHLYTSPETLDDHSPYPNAFTPHTPYSGRALLDDLKKIIADFRPTTIVFPHPNDEHPDHWAAYCYTAAALYELGLSDTVRVQLYLVHTSDWPAPRGLHRNLPLLPPTAVEATVGPSQTGFAQSETHWTVFPLGRDGQRAKYKATRRYRSQLLVMRDFLLSFDRTNELFATVPWGHLPVVAPGAISIDGSIEDWAHLTPALIDSKHKRRKMPAVADILAAYVASDGKRLFLRVDLAAPPETGTDYRVWLHLLSGGQVGPPQSYLLRPSKTVEMRPVGATLEAAVPIAEHHGVMLSVTTSREGKALDQTAWVLLRAGAEP